VSRSLNPWSRILFLASLAFGPLIRLVFGEGNPHAELLFIGEGPGEKEDLSGRPFVGPAGQKLDEMIRAMGLRREQVYIANIVKCRPPGNRAPAPEEVQSCTPYLVRQIEAIRPKVIVTLGLPATQFMLGEEDGRPVFVQPTSIDPATGAVVPPIHLASTFRQPGAGKWGKFDYSRSGNPTVRALETKLAVLENGGDMVLNLLCIFSLALVAGWAIGGSRWRAAWWNSGCGRRTWMTPGRWRRCRIACARPGWRSAWNGRVPSRATRWTSPAGPSSTSGTGE
jgi:uracil-DNA glycosylase family 4